MSRYCIYTNFFLELTNIILNGEKSLDSKKLDPAFKPPGVEQLIRLTSSDFDLSNLKDEAPENYNEPKKVKSSMPEEKGGFQNDIDGIGDVIKNKKTIDKKKILEENRL